MNTIVIYHKADYDGIFCREIARLHFGDKATYVGWDYGDPVPVVLPDEDLFILDLSIDGLMDHPRLTWIDHHKSAIDKYKPKGLGGTLDWRNARNGYCIDGVAACRLAWQWFSLNSVPQDYELPRKEKFVEREVDEPLAVRLAGEYDVWDKRDPRAQTFQFALDASPITPAGWKTLLTPGEIGDKFCNELLVRGEAAQFCIAKRDADIVKSRSFRVRFEGVRFLCLNTARCNSNTFLAAIDPDKDDALLGFFWTGKDWYVSLYGVPYLPDLDLSEIAVRWGGGGHKQACGFRTPRLPFIQTDPTTP